MHFDAANPLLPIATLAAGVFLLIAPRIVSFAVAVYLIIMGLLGLNGIYHFFKYCRERGDRSPAGSMTVFLPVIIGHQLAISASTVRQLISICAALSN